MPRTIPLIAASLFLLALNLQADEAQLKRYSAEVEFRAMQHKRMVRLVKQGTMQPQHAEETDLQYKSALAALESAGAYLLTKQARLQAAEGEISVADRRVDTARTEL